MLINNKCGKIITEPGNAYSEEKRYFQGCPTIARSRGGILYAGWYTGGTKEPSPLNCNILVKSTDNGSSWSDVILAIDSIPEAKIRAIDIQLWIDPQGAMWAFWTVRDDNYTNKHPEHLKTWAIICDDPDAETLVWSEPRYISPGFLRCQPTVLSDGRIMLYSYDWTCDYYSYSESSDNGRTWLRRRGGKKVHTPFDEAMLLERLDGSLWMLARCEEGAIAESISHDGGKTWSDGKVTDITAPSSRFFIKRMPSGRVLLLLNDSASRGREKMTAMLSDDDGKSFKWSMLIDPAERVSYPDAAISPDGVIYMVHDFERVGAKTIFFSRFTEEDIMAGKCVKADSVIKSIISKSPLEPIDKEEYNRLLEIDRVWREENNKFNAQE